MRSCIPTARTWGCPTGRWATPRWDTSISVRAAWSIRDLVKINRACKDGSIMENAEVKAAFEYAKAKGVNVHFMGLVSDGGVHSSIDHLYKLCDIAKTYGIEHTYVHCFMDGRDTDPHSGKGFHRGVGAPYGAVDGRRRVDHRPLLCDGSRQALGACEGGLRSTRERCRRAGDGHGRRHAEVLRRRRDRRVRQADRACRRRGESRRDDPSRRHGDLLQLPQRPRQGS